MPVCPATLREPRSTELTTKSVWRCVFLLPAILSLAARHASRLCRRMRGQRSPFDTSLHTGRTAQGGGQRPAQGQTHRSAPTRQRRQSIKCRGTACRAPTSPIQPSSSYAGATPCGCPVPPTPSPSACGPP
jgi:hypothetical protein